MKTPNKNESVQDGKSLGSPNTEVRGLIKLQRVPDKNDSGENPLDLPKNLSNNAAILKHDFFSMKLVDFMKKYNQELFDFKEENGM